MKNASSLANIQDSIEIRVPGSIANLGPGFDTLAVAVQLYLTLRVTVLPGKGQREYDFISYKAGSKNKIDTAFCFLAGGEADKLPSLRVEVHSEIPPGAGLGSSAAATVAGLRLYESICGPVPLQTLLNAASALESQSDNAAASLLGGLTLSCAMPDGSVYATKFPWPGSLAFIVASPVLCPDAEESRSQLPARVSRADLVFNLQRVALLLQLLRSGEFSLLRQAFDDRVHQPYRAQLVPGFREALALQHHDLLGICLSGSGPSIVAIAERNLWEIGDLLGAIYQRSRIDYHLRILEAHHEEVSSLPQDFRSALPCCS
jgi:homoserine kinase